MISIVVPIFNEEEIVDLFHAALTDAMKDEAWEAVYVNDGSTDSSLTRLTELQAQDAHVVVVDLSRNWGHMGAISAGLQTARGDAVVLMDGDFQDPPEVVPELVAAWRGGAQVVTAVRRSRQEKRKVLAKLFPLFYRLLGALSDFPIPWTRLTPCGKAVDTCLGCVPGWATKPASFCTTGTSGRAARASSRS
jgi:glycosyltransferase involved in cell wall biosynthesis